MDGQFLAVWGFAATGSEVGILGEFASREEAREAVRSFERTNDNQAAGAWVRQADEDLD